MFRKLYREANNDIKVDKSIKEYTIEKMLNTNVNKRRSKNIFKFAILMVAMVVVLYSFFNKSNRMDIYAIAEPTYPTKIKFDDLDEKINRREDIDESFLKNLKDFSIKSSSLVLRETDKDTNSLYSPISLYMALSMASETANGDTQKEILGALNMDNIEMVRSETGKLFRRLYYHNEIGKLSLGNSLWLNKDVEFNSDLLDLLAKEYYASSFSLDFNDKESPKRISK
ncbi:serpin (serine protease inhibitor) [Keratinibaculum paraultunense]|uniref:Serpin (Serine protease inhibitor) n=1 Tax=Keratinibaculum paraultunense TaxID=1278232 RepID=A0A4V2UTP7_9FIRM|nr:hypothetical protein JL105_10835 [Keratinibaculum paraultunense]TCS87083.1 serpin (serine protease inhibitor) [Keratinibaculum paraultunense]